MPRDGSKTEWIQDCPQDRMDSRLPPRLNVATQKKRVKFAIKSKNVQQGKDAIQSTTAVEDTSIHDHWTRGVNATERFSPHGLPGQAETEAKTQPMQKKFTPALVSPRPEAGRSPRQGGKKRAEARSSPKRVEKAGRSCGPSALHTQARGQSRARCGPPQCQQVSHVVLDFVGQSATKWSIPQCQHA